MDQPSGALESFSAVLVSLRPAKELGVVLSIGETEVLVVAGDRPLDRGPLARSEIRRVGANEFLLLIEGRGWQIRVDDVRAFMAQVMPRFGQVRFIRFRALYASWFGLRDPSDGTLRVTPWAVVSGLAWVVVLVVGFVLGRLETQTTGVLIVVAIAVVGLLGLRWARLAPRAQQPASPAAAILRPVTAEPVAHSAFNVGMAGDVDLVREILGDRLSGRQKPFPIAAPPTPSRAPFGSVPSPPTAGAGSGTRDLPLASVTSEVNRTEEPAPVWVETSATPEEPVDGRSQTAPGVGADSRFEASAPILPDDREGDGFFEAATVADDLTSIRGIGPRLAARLAGVGVVTFRQLADLGEADIARLQAELGTFVHRMEKDRWQEQAREAHARKLGG